VFSGAVADTGPGTRARSSLSFLSVAREGKGLGMGGLCPNVTGTHWKIMHLPMTRLAFMIVYLQVGQRSELTLVSEI
jgi:hypothetical protein